MTVDSIVNIIQWAVIGMLAGYIINIQKELKVLRTRIDYFDNDRKTLRDAMCEHLKTHTGEKYE